MKNYSAKIILTLLFLGAGGMTVVKAQVNDDAIFKINVPFAFQVRDKTMPAGEYIIRPSDATGDANTILQINNTKEKRYTALFDSIPLSVDTAPLKSNVIFGKVNNKYYLSEVWEQNNTNGNQVEEPVSIKKLEKRGIKKEKQVIEAELSKKK